MPTQLFCSLRDPETLISTLQPKEKAGTPWLDFKPSFPAAKFKDVMRQAFGLIL